MTAPAARPGALGDWTPSRLGLGTMSFTGRGTWGPPRDPDAARALLRRAAELGVQLFDTADSYGPEVAEELVREALHPYDGLLIATKGGFRRHGPHEWEADCRPESLRAACEGSLRRLGLERIDLYQLHLVDAAVPVEESVGALAELQGEGKIRHIGVCNVSPGQLERARTAAGIVSVQNRYSLVERSSRPVLARCERDGLAFVAWAPLGKGFLSAPAGALAAVARRHGATAGQVALAWVLRSPAAFAIPGTSSLSHLEENVGARGLELTAEDAAELEREGFRRYGRRRLVRKARARAGRVKAALRGPRR
ncbi:MAG TPA: aldo/keto reductase [Gaiellaceae bacterium]|nr:aldo/keto reductase [Gaiellaceae bacterium]